MQMYLIWAVLGYIHFSKSEERLLLPLKTGENNSTNNSTEDQRAINKTIAKYVPSVDSPPSINRIDDSTEEQRVTKAISKLDHSPPLVTGENDNSDNSTEDQRVINKTIAEDVASIDSSPPMNKAYNCTEEERVINKPIARYDHSLISPPLVKEESDNGVNLTEDQRVINATIAKYGPLVDHQILGLPGPELGVEENKLNHTNKLDFAHEGTYTLRIRTITEYFSYNARYEEGTLRKENNTEIPIIKGQFGEHFKRESGGFYIRTLGYVIDESGYRQFLIDLTKTEITFKIAISPSVISSLAGGGGGGGPGGVGGTKISISSTVLITLTGGNSLG